MSKSVPPTSIFQILSISLRAVFHWGRVSLVSAIQTGGGISDAIPLLEPRRAMYENFFLKYRSRPR